MILAYLPEGLLNLKLFSPLNIILTWNAHHPKYIKYLFEYVDTY